MTPHRDLRVVLDGEAFFRHRRSGISRYFAELAGAYLEINLGVEALMPYKYVANVHLSERLPRSFWELPLPWQLRPRVLGAMNTRRLRRVRDVDVVHHSLYERTAFDRYQGRARVTTIYDFTFERFPHMLAPDVMAKAMAEKLEFIERSDGLLCISQATYDDLQAFHPHLDKPVAVTPLAANVRFFTPTGPRIARLPQQYVLHVGNRHRHKNVDVIFAAFARVAATRPGLGLVLCGNPVHDEADRLAAAGIANRTTVVNVSDADLPALYRDAAAFVFPSRYEGFGLPLVEAMAAGSPVLLADTPALTEVAGEAGIVFDADDADALTIGLERLLEDPSEAERMRAAGRQRAADFTWARTARLTAALYREVARTGQ